MRIRFWTVPSQKRERQKAGRQSRQQAAVAAQRRQSRKRAVITGVVLLAIVALIAGATGLFSGDNGKKVASDSSTTTPGATTTPKDAPSTVKGETVKGQTPCPKADGSSPRTTTFELPPPVCTDRNKNYTATMKTSQGTITIALDAKKAPATVNNFVVLSRYHFYDGLTFHRIVPGFVIQGGDPQGTGSGGPGYKFIDEVPQAGAYKAGSLAMANSGPNTNGSQFFIVVSDDGAKQLQPLYSLFGDVTAGMDVVKKIEALGDASSPNGAPKETVTIESVTIAES